jgi:hypothetical protein
LEAESGVEPHPVVKDCDPFKDGSSGFGPRGELATMHQFPFEAAQKLSMPALS